MEMSIDEAIEIISDIDKAYRTFSNMEYKAMQKSIDVMRKYQCIQAIINNAKDSDGAVKYNWLYEQIGEVIEHE